MDKIENVVSYKIAKFVPDEVKGKSYVKLEKGQKITITGGVYSVYPAHNDEGQPIIRQDGTQVMRVIAYITMADGTYSTVKGDIALSQLMSVTGVIDVDSEGRYPFTMDESVTVTEVNQKFGTKDYPVIAFTVE